MFSILLFVLLGPLPDDMLFRQNLRPLSRPGPAMKRCIFLCFAISIAMSGVLHATEEPVNVRLASQSCMEYNNLNNRIRDGRISKTAAGVELIQRLSEVRKEYYLLDGKNYAASEWVFPVAGYDTHAIDGGRSHGFISSGYDFFSGNRHGGHPAFDIFIKDRNQDSRDDRTGQPAEVLSMTGGIVVALEREWKQPSGLRGGKYIWVYDPANELLVYYAHNNELRVQLGDLVKPGDVLATVGRSGLNAAKRRSPTHLHFSVLLLINGKPTPLNVYQALKQSRKMP